MVFSLSSVCVPQIMGEAFTLCERILSLSLSFCILSCYVYVCCVPVNTHGVGMYTFVCFGHKEEDEEENFSYREEEVKKRKKKMGISSNFVSQGHWERKSSSLSTVHRSPTHSSFRSSSLLLFLRLSFFFLASFILLFLASLPT